MGPGRPTGTEVTIGFWPFTGGLDGDGTGLISTKPRGIGSSTELRNTANPSLSKMLKAFLWEPYTFCIA